MSFSESQPSISLCLACSSSLLPKSSADAFITPCCRRWICHTCVSSNPRLRRYNPCLSCLGGVAVVGAANTHAPLLAVNLDGAMRDEDTFILGDDEDEDDTVSSADKLSTPGTPPPAYLSMTQPPDNSSHSESVTPVDNEEDSQVNEKSNATPRTYLIARGDTLQGIAFRFGVNGRDLCRLNNLPPSTLSTTPHLLHTRVSLNLPPSARPILNRPPSQTDPENEARRTRERAEKRLQTLTKEVDWRVARAYIALADDPDEEAFHIKFKEGQSTAGHNSLEARAVDQYLEDQEWEEEQKRQGNTYTQDSVRKVLTEGYLKH